MEALVSNATLNRTLDFKTKFNVKLTCYVDCVKILDVLLIFRIDVHLRRIWHKGLLKSYLSLRQKID